MKIIWDRKCFFEQKGKKL